MKNTLAILLCCLGICGFATASEKSNSKDQNTNTPEREDRSLFERIVDSYQNTLEITDAHSATDRHDSTDRDNGKKD